jgi:hypothetical protein
LLTSGYSSNGRTLKMIEELDKKIAAEEKGKL